MIYEQKSTKIHIFLNIYYNNASESFVHKIIGGKMN